MQPPLTSEPADKSKKSRREKAAREARQAGSGWGFNLMKYIIPKRKNEAHLPDDSKPSVRQGEGRKEGGRGENGEDGT